jgi:hypothetical protein
VDLEVTLDAVAQPDGGGGSEHDATGLSGGWMVAIGVAIVAATTATLLLRNKPTSPDNTRRPHAKVEVRAVMNLASQVIDTNLSGPTRAAVSLRWSVGTTEVHYTKPADGLVTKRT